jgi:hypothetical protein
MEQAAISKNVVVRLVDWKAAIDECDPSEPPEPPEPPKPVADILIQLWENGDVTHERHNVNTCTARSLMIGCYVMLGETMELVGGA